MAMSAIKMQKICGETSTALPTEWLWDSARYYIAVSIAGLESKQVSFDIYFNLKAGVIVIYSKNRRLGVWKRFKSKVHASIHISHLVATDFCGKRSLLL